jgi:enamine deaminase RidA (YjgF/YER057c/UK114 family)
MPALVAGDMLHVSMQGPVSQGRLAHVGRLGAEVGIEEGRSAAELATLNAVAQIRAALGGFERLEMIVRLDGCVACTDDFFDHPKVLDAASELLVRIFEDRAGHVRSVSGVRNLPGNVPVALVVLARLRLAGATPASSVPQGSLAGRE